MTLVAYRLRAVSTEPCDLTELESDSDVAEPPISDDRGKSQSVTSFVSLCGKIIRFYFAATILTKDIGV